jgi:hypothetical protein
MQPEAFRFIGARYPKTGHTQRLAVRSTRRSLTDKIWRRKFLIRINEKFKFLAAFLKRPNQLGLLFLERSKLH